MEINSSNSLKLVFGLVLSVCGFCLFNNNVSALILSQIPLIVEMIYLRYKDIEKLEAIVNKQNDVIKEMAVEVTNCKAAVSSLKMSTGMSTKRL